MSPAIDSLTYIINIQKTGPAHSQSVPLVIRLNLVHYSGLTIGIGSMVKTWIWPSINYSTEQDSLRYSTSQGGRCMCHDSRSVLHLHLFLWRPPQIHLWRTAWLAKSSRLNETRRSQRLQLKTLVYTVWKIFMSVFLRITDKFLVCAKHVWPVNLILTYF